MSIRLRKFLPLFLTGLLCACATRQTSAPAVPAPSPAEAAVTTPAPSVAEAGVEALVASMTLREKIGQL
ncbi:MAG: hypothetical protein ACI4OI_05045, partial [Gemmiger sp.]